MKGSVAGVDCFPDGALGVPAARGVGRDFGATVALTGVRVGVGNAGSLARYDGTHGATHTGVGEGVQAGLGTGG